MSSLLVVIRRGRLSDLVTSQETRDACWLHRDVLCPLPRVDKELPGAKLPRAIAGRLDVH